MQCEIVESQLVEIIDTPDGASPLVDHHLKSCLRCQAEVAKYKKLRRASLSLKDRVLVPDDELLSDILEAVRPPATVHRIHGRSRKAMYVGGIAVSAAAGALVVATRFVARERMAS